MAKAIIFGASGQDGFYLKELLILKGIEVIPVSRFSGLIKGDVGDSAFVKNLIKQERPEYIFHFAARSTTNHNALEENHYSISGGTLNILESARIHSPHSRIFLSGSALQFRNDSSPINEETPFCATSAYSTERIYSVSLGRYFRQAFNMKIYFGYLFNHDSPIRTENHINKLIVSTVTKIKNGSLEKLKIGDPDVKKEFSFAGDIVNAIWILVNQDNCFETVIGSGKAYKISEWLEYCFFKISRKWEDHVVIDLSFKSDYEILVSDPTKIKLLGWDSVVSFTDLADMMMEKELLISDC